MIPTRSRQLGLILFFLLIYIKVSCQFIPTSTQYFSYDQGLPERTVYDIYKDSRGMMWVSTAVGISMFDGKGFQNFSNIDIPNISKKINIRGDGQISEDRNKNLIIIPWEKTNSIEILNIHSFQSSKINLDEHPSISGNVQDIYINPLDYCYILSKDESSFFIYKINKALEIELLHTIPNASNSFSDKNKLHVVAQNDFWIFDFGKQKITHHLPDGNIQDFLINKNSSVPTALEIFHQDQKGFFWFSSTKDSQLYKIPTEQNNFESVYFIDNQPLYTHIWEDNVGNLMFAEIQQNYGYHLLIYLNDGEAIDLPHIIKTESKITNLESDDFSKYFFVTSHNGFYQFTLPSNNSNIKQFLNKELEAGEFGSIIRGFAEDNSGNVYVNTEGGNWYSVNTSTWKITHLPIKDKNGNLLTNRSCGTNLIFDGTYLWGTSCQDRKQGMIHRYEIATQQWENFPFPFNNHYARSILPKSENEFWVFTYEWDTKSSDIFVLNTSNKVFTNYKKLTGVTSPLQGKILLNRLVDSSGMVWLATTRGLIKFDTVNESFQTYYINEEIKEYNIISTIHELENNQLLIGTYEQGLFIFDEKKEQFTNFRFSEKYKFSNSNKLLPNSFIAGIVPVDENNFLISTFNGLAYLDVDENRVAHFFTKNGLSNNEYNRMAHLTDKNGNIYLGGINGFDVFSINDLQVQKTLPKPLITRFFKYNDDSEKQDIQFENLAFQQTIQIKPDVLQFGFDFLLPDYFDVENNLYQTWLEGWEKNYQPPTTKSSIDYFRLPAGNYKLHIKGVDSFGNSSSEDLVIPIKVQQVFYKSYWFLALCLTSLIGGIIFLAKRRIEKIKTEEQRAKELRLIEQRFTELELKTVRLQLNPHFMFNALGAIQHYIDDNNKRLAINYLADFARLMRLFLESSKKRFVTLAEEMELIQLYVSLEQMRFEHKFDVQYNIADDIDPDIMELPSLLLQPFIENAINHGLYHKKEKGLLSIEVQSKHEDHLQFVIEDNGIGRARAAEIKKQSLRKHKSRGTEIVQERLETLNASGEVILELSVDDAFKNQEDCGTKVVISITEGE